MKYADASQPVRISCGRDGRQVHLTLSNGISGLRDRKESTNIGLNTCERILRMHEGAFEASEEGGRFTVLAVLPISDDSAG